MTDSRVNRAARGRRRTAVHRQPPLPLTTPVVDRERVIRMAEELKRIDPVGFYFTVSNDIRVEVYQRAWARRAVDLDPEQISSAAALSGATRPGRAAVDELEQPERPRG